jgi:hypothetical protein
LTLASVLTILKTTYITLLLGSQADEETPPVLLGSRCIGILARLAQPCERDQSGDSLTLLVGEPG